MTLLAFFKFAGIGLTGLFGILGLIFDFKDKATNKITRSGWVALGGIVISTGVALASQAIEQREAEASALAELRRNTVLLRQISNTLQPLQTMYVTYEVSVDVEAPEFASYKRRLEAGVKDYLQKAAPGFAFCQNCDFEASVIRAGEVQRLRTLPRSKYFPDQQSEAFAYSALDFQAHVCLWKTPQSNPAPCDDYEGGDLQFPVGFPDERGGLNFSHYLEIDTRSLDIVVEDDELKELESYKRSDGKLLTIPDLAGGQIIVALKNAPSWRPKSDDPGVIESYDLGVSGATKKVRAVRLELEVPGHRYTFTPPALESRVIDGEIYLVATFPSKASEIANLEQDCRIFEDGVRRCRAPRSPPPLPPPNFLPPPNLQGNLKYRGTRQ